MLSQFTSVNDVSNLDSLLRKCFEVKENPHNESNLGTNKCLGLIFFNPSLRTRMSTQRAALNLGLDVICLNAGEDGWKLEMSDGVVMDGDNQEHINDAIEVMGSYCNIIGVRCFAGLKNKNFDYEETLLHKFITYSKVPVVNLESATLHPLQSLTDLMTIEESTNKKRPKIVLSWAPHPKVLPQAVSNSFLEWMRKGNHEVVITHPKGYELSEEYSKGFEIQYNQEIALANADFVYAKNWSRYEPYGFASDELGGWLINEEKMQLTNNAKFMHCLPIRRNVVATDGVLNGSNSLVFKQAKNRVFAAQAVLSSILKSL